MVEERTSSSWKRQLVSALVGALLGGALGFLLYLFLFQVGFARQVARPRLMLAMHAIIGWLILLGGLAAWRGKCWLRSVESELLPSDIGSSGRSLFRIGALFGVLAVLHYHVSSFLLEVPTDLPSFILAARAMAAGADFYDPTVLLSYNDPGESEEWFRPFPHPFPYLYLPFFAVLLRPLAILPVPTAYAAVLLINAALWPLLIYLSLRLVEAPEKIRAPILALALLLFPSFFPTIFTLHHGSPSLLVAVLVVGALVAERDGRSRIAGVLLALAILIKIVPIFLVAYLALRRRWRALAATAVACVAFMMLSVAVAGFDSHVHWLTQMAPELASGARTNTFFEPSCHPENQTFTSLCCRLIGRNSPLYRPISSGLGGLVLLFTGLVLWRRRRPRIDRLEGAVMAVTLLLVSTITWFHHMTLMILPVLALSAEATLHEKRWRVVLAVIALAVTVGVGFEFYLNPWTFIAPNPLTHSIRFLSMLLTHGALLGLILSERWKTQPREDS